MKDESSIFDADPENLDELVFAILGEPGGEENSSTASIADGVVEQLGGQIGQYKLLSVLGEGGMGIVYLAEQKHPIRRKVALKVIKPGMDSKRVIARFEAERQALALLDHPYIAHVHDAGMTEKGRPYFVMECVSGLPITEHCDRHKLTIKDRLDLFRQVCLAVQHAHQKGIIHRDIKPSNILVSAENDRPTPKVIDFGVAKAIAAPLTQKTLFTEDSQLLGTPEYMSPEQADMATEDIDTRSDIYSLGVLLYELLTGVLPFDSDTLRAGGIEHIRQIIRETDPKTPSTRLTKLGDQAREVANNRRTEIAALAKRLHRELEWIPLKAMRKERSERYRSASELADDIENYLRGNPLIAGPESTVYLVKKFVRRKRSLVTAIAAVLVVLIAGIVISTVLAIGQARARAKAQRIAYASDMSLAQKALEMNDMGRARQLLEDHRPARGQVDLRGWEWRYLWQECRSDALGEFCHYEKPLACSVAYSTDGRVLAVAGILSGFVEIWDVPSRKPIKTLQRQESRQVAFSPRGDLLATTAGDQIWLWRTGTWDRVDHGQLTLDGGVRDLKFSPDGKRLAGLSFPGELAVWELDPQAVIRQIPGLTLPKAYRGDLDFSPDGKALVIGDADGCLRAIDLASRDTIFDVSETHPEGIISVAWSPSDSIIASGSSWEEGGGGPILLWDAASGRPLGELDGHTSWISDMVFSKDGVRLYSASDDQTIRVWDVGQMRCLATLRGSRHGIMGLALSPDGTTLASVCKDGVVAFWSADPRPREEWPMLIPLDHPSRPAFAPNSRVLALPCAEAVRLLDLDTYREIERIPELVGADVEVEVVAYSPDGTLLVSGSATGKTRVWSCTRRCLLKELDDHDARIGLLRFRADGTRMLSLDATGQAIWWDTLTWQVDSVMELPAELNEYWPALDVSPDGRLLAFGTRTGDVYWLDAETGELLARRSGDPRTIQVAFSGDGLRVASTSLYGTVTLWDSSSLRRLADPFRAHLMGAHGVALSPDNRRLATGGSTSRDAVKLWDLSTQRELIALPAQSATYRFVVFSNDGRWLAARSSKGNLHLWLAPSWEEIEAEEKRLKNGQSL